MRKLLYIPLLFCLSLQSWATWNVTNKGQDISGTGAITFSSSLTNPSTIIVVCRYALADSNFGVNDTAGNSFTDSGLGAVQVLSGTPRDTLRILVAANTHTTASDVVTCDNHGATVFIAAYEFTGCTACGVVDGKIAMVNQSASTGANTVIFSNYNTTVNGDLIFATYFCLSCSGFTAGTSPVTFTLTGETILAVISEYATQTSAGSIGPTFGVTGTITWGGMSIAIEPAAGITRHRAQVINSQ